MLPFLTVLGLFSTVVYGVAILTPYADGQCKNRTKLSLNGGVPSHNISIVALGSQWNHFSSVGFPDLPPGPVSSSGSQVWWSLAQPDAGCRIVLMLPYTQSAYNDTGNKVPGNVILNVGNSGCYYTDLPVSNVLYPALIIINKVD
jgi:hypothetical protein